MRFEENEEVEAQLKELEYLVKKCRIHYEQFFMGNEKREPSDLRRKIQNFLKNSAIEKHRRASIKFRYLTITQKFVTLSNYWDRILRTMEDGTFNTMTYRGFRPRAADEDETRPATADREERGAVHVDPEEMERESIARLAEHWGKQQVVDEPSAPVPDLSPDDLEQIFPPEAERHNRPDVTTPMPTPARPVPQPATGQPPAAQPVAASARTPAPPSQPEPRPSQRPTVPLDVPQPARPAPHAPPPAAPLAASAAAPAAVQAAKTGAPTATRARTPEPLPGPVEVIPGARRLYDKYRQAKVNAIADSEDLSYEQFESRLAKKRDMLKEKFQQEFEFDVVAREGKVSIVAKKR